MDLEEKVKSIQKEFYGFDSHPGYSFNNFKNNILQPFSVKQIRSLAVLLAVDGLVSKEKMQKPFDFKKARLVRSTGSDGWYILF